MVVKINFINILLALCFVVVESVSDSENAKHIVTLKEGKISGKYAFGVGGSAFIVYKGIPYAHVPVRFSAPVAPLPWKGVRDGAKHGPKCPQYNMLIDKYIPGNENCLFLNIYTKSVHKTAKYPVIVFIHGGSFMFGDGDSDVGGDSVGTFGPAWLLQHDVLLVTLNYRLEVLGFLTLDTPEVPGNAGIKDQVAALRWIKENIAKFGGDPDNVTIYGESSGAAAVTQHLQSLMSKGLFHKAIAQSGVSIVDWAEGKNGKDRALRAAKFLGYNDTTGDTKRVLQYLRSVPVEKLTGLTFETMTKEEEHRDLPLHFAPVVEKKFDNVEAFMTEEVLATLTAGRMNKVPLMIGYNSDEAMTMLKDALSKLNFTNENLKYLVPREIAEKVTENKAKELGENIVHFYTGNSQFSSSNIKALIDMLSDRNFIYNVHRFTHFYSSLAPTYLYKFSCDTKLNAVKTDIGYSHMKGAAHADDLFYVFDSIFNREIHNKNETLKNLVYRVTKLWADVAKTGHPTSSYVNEHLTWTPYTASNRAFMNIDQEFSVGENTERSRVEFWDRIYCEAGVPCITKEVYETKYPL